MPTTLHRRTERERQFLFGRGGDVNENVEQSVYWSVHDPTGATDQERASGEPSDFESGSRQTFWQKVPHVEKVSEIVGSAAYGGRIYLFLKRRRDGAEKLILMKYDLRWDQWTTPQTLSLPKTVEIAYQKTVRTEIDENLRRQSRMRCIHVR